MAESHSNDLSHSEALDMLYGIGHDLHELNQPLTAIFGQLDLLGMKLKDTEHHQRVETCISQAEKLAALVSQMIEKYPRPPE